MNDCQTLRLLHDDAVMRVEMARPDSHNAFDPKMIAEMTAVFHAAADGGGARVIVLSGAGRSFSAGADLDYMRSIAAYGTEENVADARRLAAMFAAVRDCPAPVVARVHGAAMGGGVGLVAACDVAVAAEGTRFAFSEARLGIVPAVIAPFVVPRIGVAAARELFLTGERFGAHRAAAIGLVARVVPASTLDEAVADRVAALLAAGPEAQAAIKRLIPRVAGSESDLTATRAQLIAERRASGEGREGMAAFFDRRRPGWASPSGGGGTDAPSDSAGPAP